MDSDVESAPAHIDTFEMWPDRQAGPWQVSAVIGVVAGRKEIVGVTIRSAYNPKDPSDFRFADLLPPSDGSGDRHPLPVTTQVLRAPFGPVLARLLGRFEGAEPVDDDPRPIETVTTRIKDFEEFEPDPENPNALASRRIDANHVAAVYRQAYLEGASPTKAVADYFEITHDSAAARVRRARAKGLLPPARRGTAAGEPIIHDRT